MNSPPHQDSADDGLTPDQLQQAINDQATDQGPPPDVQACSNTLTWVEVRLVDMEGNPVGGKRCRITTPDGAVAEATLDKTGKMRLDGIPPGTCDITFPDLDKDAWDRV